MHIFLEDFQGKKQIYENELEKTTATVLSFDHTFKVSKNIGVLRENDAKFVEQFSNLFVGLNENKEIVTWCLTRSTKFENIENNLKELKKRLDKESVAVRVIFVDDCCKVRGKYQSVFGAEQEVKLDLFHAVQRITSTLRKGTEVSKKFANEFGLVFRNNADLGQTRNMPTPPPNIIEENINNFERRWKDVLTSPGYEKTQHEIDKIKVHVRKGCLSGINPGEGTAVNENLHHFINRCLLCNSKTIGPELAVAVLTVLFYTINSKRKRYHHDKNSRISIPIPVESVVHECKDSTASSLTAVTNQENVGTQQTSVESPLLLVGESVDDFCQEDVAETILKHSNEIDHVLKQINTANQNRSFNVFDAPLLELKGLHRMIYTETIDQQLVDDIVKQNVLARNLSGLGLEEDMVEGDGNCCFKSIIRQVSNLLANLQPPTKDTVENHLSSLGLFMEDSCNVNDAPILRQLFVEHIHQNINEYSTVLGLDENELVNETERFRESGIFYSDVGDIVVKVCSEILNMAIIVVTSMDTAPYIPFLPARFCCDTPLFVAYTSGGLGHYNSTKMLRHVISEGMLI